MSSVVTEHRTCPRCKTKWDRTILRTPAGQEYVSGGSWNCPECRKDRPEIKSEVVKVPVGSVFVWDEKPE